MESRFDLSAGSLCLDFTNTCEERARPETDKLDCYADLVGFFAEAGVVDSRGMTKLHRLATADPPAACAACDQARRLRESIYRVFSALAAGRAVPSADIDELNRGLSAGIAHRHLVPSGDGFVLGWHGLGDSFLAPLHRVAHAAAELLTSCDLDRVRECASDHCDWLFLDRSRNRSRRWCSMETCGNRSKARRHYDRRKG